MTAGEDDTSQQYARISDIHREPLEMHMPIRGFETMPLVSLEEAVVPLIPVLPEIEDYVYVAKQRIEPIPADGLTTDESAAIMLYSMDWEPQKECLYFVLNDSLRAEDRQKLKPWFLYLKLILTGLAKIPSCSRTVYRGVKLDLSKKYPEGKKFVWWGFSSCSSTIGVLESQQFLGKSGKRTLFTIECDSGKDISRHSYYQTENEILLLAARQFVVISSCQPASKLNMIQLKEIPSPISLLQLIPNNTNPNRPSLGKK
jgi:hypothetical protein